MFPAQYDADGHSPSPRSCSVALSGQSQRSHAMVGMPRLPTETAPGHVLRPLGTSGLLSDRAITGVLTPVIVDVAMNAWPTSASFEDLGGFVEFSAPIGFGAAPRFLCKVNVQGTLGRVLVDVP